ncbi:hypothetical protein GCM10009841_32960 [Microlunatus panaciterrae]
MSVPRTAAGWAWTEPNRSRPAQATHPARTPRSESVAEPYTRGPFDKLRERTRTPNHAL